MIERLLAAERALASGQLETADRLFGQVAEADERNAMAVAGLAEVALARGDAGSACELAQRALAIDPEDAAAARVLATTAPQAVAANRAVERSTAVEGRTAVERSSAVERGADTKRPPSIEGPRSRPGFWARLRRLLRRG